MLIVFESSGFKIAAADSLLLSMELRVARSCIVLVEDGYRFYSIFLLIAARVIYFLESLEEQGLPS